MNVKDAFKQTLYAFYLLQNCLMNIGRGRTGKDNWFNYRLMFDVVNQEIKALEHDLKELEKEEE